LDGVWKLLPGKLNKMNTITISATTQINVFIDI
jgi:hypothetical protein